MYMCMCECVFVLGNLALRVCWKVHVLVHVLQHMRYEQIYPRDIAAAHRYATGIAVMQVIYALRWRIGYCAS